MSSGTGRVPDLLTVEEAARHLRVGRTKACAMAREWRATGGRSGLPVVDFGSVLRVPRHALELLIGAELTGTDDNLDAVRAMRPSPRREPPSPRLPPRPKRRVMADGPPDALQVPISSPCSTYPRRADFDALGPLFAHGTPNVGRHLPVRPAALEALGGKEIRPV